MHSWSSHRAVIALVLLASSFPARATLRDVGPVNPATGYPAWYRDLGGLPLEPCMTTTASPNPAAGFGPMCFPLVSDPAGFAGNFGMELFYSDAVASVSGAAGFAAGITLALEGSYGTSVPTRSQEIVFTRIRIVMDIHTPGTYTVTHPYGVEVFTGVQAGKRAVFFTEDVGLTPGVFTTALNSRFGPFMQWDFVNPGETLTIGSEVYVGDPNYVHTVTGSPFGTNYFRVDGPPGSNISGIGNDFIQTPLFSVLGKKYTVPIPTALAITRATYGQNATTTQIDLAANSTPGARLVATGFGMPTVQLVGNGLGKYFAHVEYTNNGPPPSTVTVTNLTDVPPSAVTAPLKDFVTISKATYDVSTSTLTVVARTSDTFNPPTLDIINFTPGTMSLVAGDPSLRTFTASLSPVPPATIPVPPWQIIVQSNAGGGHTEPTEFVVTGILAPAAPVAADDAVSVPKNSAATTIAVAANDTYTILGSLVLLSPAANGTVVPTAGNPAAFDYTPKPNFSGTDSFSYVLVDSSGVMSNAATVTVTVTFVNSPPVANNDSVTMTKGTVKTFSVVANDTDFDGFVNPATVAIVTQPASGTVTANLNGTVTYTPPAAFVGVVTFQYTVQDNVGATSNVATVTVNVFAAAEVLTVTRAEWTASKAKWVVVGSTNIFGPTFSNTVTVHLGGSVTGTVLGTAQIDALGKFTFAPAPTSVPGPDATKSITVESTGGGRVTAPVTLR